MSEGRILVVRADRIGDVILSTPVFEVIKKHYPGYSLTVLVQAAVAPLLEGLSSVDEVMIYDPAGEHSGLRGFWKLLSQIRKGQFQISVVLQSQLKIAAALFFARIRYRVGPYSKIHSFFLFNRGVRQRRSQVEMHETDYNLQLLRRLGIRVGGRDVSTAVHVSPEVREQARSFLEERGWQPAQAPDGSDAQPLILVHPGMGGSALNWPETHYTDLIRALLRDDRKVLVTGGPAETDLIKRIGESLGPLREKLIVFLAGPGQKVNFLAALMGWAKVIVAPSTGPLHLAVAMKKPVVAFYPPIRVQSALRWGPYVRDDREATVLVPEVYCGEDFRCRGNLCNHFPCMKTITVAHALEKVNSHYKSVSVRNEK